MGFAIYTSAFNCVKNKFPLLDPILNFSAFAEELVVAVNTSEDETYNLVLLCFEQARKVGSKCRMVVIKTNFSYEDPLLDGKIKNAALQTTTEKWKISLDLDERIPLKDKKKWIMMANLMDRNKMVDAYLIPSVNLWGDYRHIRWDNEQNISFKWYLHKENLRRGPVDFGLKDDGHIDREKSDTCEILNPDGSLARSSTVINQNCKESLENYLSFLRENIHVFHLGYSDFDQKIHRYKEFWERHWEVEAGIPHDKPLKKDELGKHKTYLHNLPLWDQREN